MATTPRNGKPYVYASWLTKVIAGEEQCTYQPWFKAHFRFDKRPGNFNFAAWTIDHKALVERHADGLRVEGWTVSLEDANALKLFGKTAILSLKPDIIAERAPGELLVVDAKTGAQRHSDFVQVLMYMLALLRSRGDIRSIRGAVVYEDHVVPVTREELTPAMEETIFAAVRAAATVEPPDASPSARGCSFCDIAGCNYRIEEETPAAMVAEF